MENAVYLEAVYACKDIASAALLCIVFLHIGLLYLKTKRNYRYVSQFLFRGEGRGDSRFHRVGGHWDRTQDCCGYGTGNKTL